MDVTQENIIQVWRVMVLHRSTQIYQLKLSFEVGGSLKGEISIQIIKTARLKDERTGMVLKYLLNTRGRGGRPQGDLACSQLVPLWKPGNIIEIFDFFKII